MPCQLASPALTVDAAHDGGGGMGSRGAGELGMRRRGGGVWWAGAGKKKVGEGRRNKKMKEVKCLEVEDEEQSLDFDPAVKKSSEKSRDFIPKQGVGIDKAPFPPLCLTLLCRWSSTNL